MTTDRNEDCFTECLDALNNILDLCSKPEIVRGSPIAEALRLYANGLHVYGMTPEHALREYTDAPKPEADKPAVPNLSATRLAQARRRKMLAKFPLNGLVSTKAGRHLHLIGFNEEGFAMVEAFDYDSKRNALVFGNAVFALPVQTTLMACTVQLFNADIDKSVMVGIEETCASRAAIYRNDYGYTVE